MNQQHIIIRTNASHSTGLGHLVRCIHLAREFISRKQNVLLVIDYIEPNINKFLNGIEVVALYSTHQGKINEVVDAALLLKHSRKLDVSWVIVDDYRLNKNWESLINDSGVKICVIDDTLRSHKCDVIVDMRWRGVSTPHEYDDLVSSEAIKLLGPKYAILASDYKKPVINREKREVFSIMIGNLGNLERCENVIKHLIKHQVTFSRQIEILIVLGPFVEDSQAFIAYFKEFKNVKFLIGETNLYPYLCQTDFYIGAAGGIIYQLACLNIPALTFSLSENQGNDIYNLEKLGYYFHLDKWPSKYEQDLITFIEAVISNYKVIKSLLVNSPIAVDGLSSDRIADVILHKAIPEETNLNVSKVVNEKSICLTTSHIINTVTHKNINHFLLSRNLTKNHQNMIQTNVISTLHHYGWWFNNSRESFLLLKSLKPCLYIWHELRKYKEKKYLIGGWFVCNEDADFQDALLAVNWQLQFCSKQYVDVPWFAVIQRKNKFVKLLNQYLGFQEVTPEHDNYDEVQDIINVCFKGATNEEYHFVTYQSTN